MGLRENGIIGGGKLQRVLFAQAAIVERGDAHEIFEVFAQKTLVGEMELSGDFLDTVVGVAETVFDLHDDHA